MITALAIAVTDATLSPSTPPSPSTPSTPSASPSPSSAAASSAAAFTLLIYSNTTAAAAAAAGDDSGVGGEKGPLVEEPLLLLPTNLPHLHHHHHLLLLGVSLVAAMCTSLFANLLLLGVFYRRPGLLFHIANRFVFNLIVADLLQTTVAMPLCLAPLLSASRPAASYCHVAVALSHLFAFAGVNTIAVVSVDRYLAIIHPLSYPAKMTPRRAANLIACTWAIGALQGGPPLLGWGAAAHDAATGLCAPLWSAHASYAAYVSVATFWLPVCVMLCCYVMVFRAARRQNLLVRPLRRVWSGGGGVDAAVVSAGGGGGEGEGGGGGGGGGDGGGEGGEGGAGQGQAKERRRYRQHWKAARVVFLILASNVLCTAPYSALGAVAARAPCWVRACAALLFFSQCCVHPYIYGYMHRSIRREIVRALCGLHVPGAGDGGGLAAGGGGAQPRPGGTSADSGQTRSEWRRRRRTMRRMRRTRGRTRRRCGVTQSEPADGSNTDSGAQPLCSSAADSALPSSALPSSATDGSGARHCGGAAGAVRSALPCCSSSSSGGGSGSGGCCVEESAQQQHFAPADSVHCFSTVDSALPCRPNGSALPCISS